MMPSPDLFYLFTDLFYLFTLYFTWSALSWNFRVGVHRASASHLVRAVYGQQYQNKHEGAAIFVQGCFCSVQRVGVMKLIVNTCSSYMNRVVDELKNHDFKSNNLPWGFHPGKVVLNDAVKREIPNQNNAKAKKTLHQQCFSFIF